MATQVTLQDAIEARAIIEGEGGRCSNELLADIRRLEESDRVAAEAKAAFKRDGSMKLVRHTIRRDVLLSHEGGTYYTTADGRFQISKTWCGEVVWQATATDGSKPFRIGWGGKTPSNVFNGETLRECREEIEAIAE